MEIEGPPIIQTDTTTDVYAIALFSDRPGQPPSQDMIDGDPKYLVVGVNFDGSVVIGPGWDADGAALNFWRRVAHLVQESMGPLMSAPRRSQQPS
jgi:hypothetical protein